VHFRWSDLKFERLVLIGQRQRQGPARGSAGRTPRGQNHGVERCPYSFFRGRDKS
jgi:hypothetical protein